MSAHEEVNQQNEDAHMADEMDDNALESVSTKSSPSPPPTPPAATGCRKRYREKVAAAVKRSAASVVRRAADDESTIDEPCYKVAERNDLTKCNAI
jgi:hypothetical protein